MESKGLFLMFSAETYAFFDENRFLSLEAFPNFDSKYQNYNSRDVNY